MGTFDEWALKLTQRRAHVNSTNLYLRRGPGEPPRFDESVPLPCSLFYSGSRFASSTSRFISPNAAERIGPPIASWFSASTGPCPR